eukprot:3476630-Amphidinium_carterae.1
MRTVKTSNAWYISTVRIAWFLAFAGMLIGGFEQWHKTCGNGFEAVVPGVVNREIGLDCPPTREYRLARFGTEILTGTKVRSWVVGAFLATSVDARNTGHGLNASRTNTTGHSQSSLQGTNCR